MISFSCSNCGQNYTVADDKAGRRAKCKKCGYGVTVPQLASVPMPPIGVPTPRATVGDRISVVCPSCGSGQRVPVQVADRMLTCRHCGEVRWWRWDRDSTIEPLSLVLPPVVDVVTDIFRREHSVELRVLWTVITQVFTRHMGYSPLPAQLVDIERQVVESRFETYLSAPWNWPSDNKIATRRTEGWGHIRGGTPFHVREDTSPAQDNAIRVMEGD